MGAQNYAYDPSNTPTTGTCNSWPFGVYTDWRFQFILNAPALFKTPVKITEIAFAPCTSGTWTAKQFQFRMGHTTHKDFSTSGTTKFDKMLGPCPTVMYNGPISFAATSGAWSDIGLQAPFGWDGTRNICGEIRYKARGSLSMSCRRDSTTPRAYTHSGYSGDAYNATDWYTPIPGEVMMLKMRLTYYNTCILRTSDTVSISGSGIGGIKFLMGPPGEFYQIAASLGQTPLPVGPCTVYLAMDGLFWASLLVGPPVFNNYAGMLDGSGSAAATIAVPNNTALVGICVYHAGVAYDKKGAILCCTNTDGMQIVP